MSFLYWLILFLKARDEISDNDSECENDDYMKNTLITTYQTGKDRHNIRINIFPEDNVIDYYLWCEEKSGWH